MKNILKVKAKTSCNLCGCVLNRTKTIKVSACEKTLAIVEAQRKVTEWRKSLIGKNCKVCQSIIDAK